MCHGRLDPEEVDKSPQPSPPTGIIAGLPKQAKRPGLDEEYPQFFHHCSRRSRQIHAGGPLHPGMRRPGRARDAGAGARFAWIWSASAASPSRRRASRSGFKSAERRDVPAQLHRHAGARRLLLRGFALARSLRGRVAGGRRRAGRRGAERRQLLYRAGTGPGSAAGHQQDRSALRRSGQGDPRNRGDHRHTGRGCRAGQRQDRRGRARSAGTAGQAHSGAARAIRTARCRH